MTQLSIPQALELAMQRLRAGQLQQAESIYRQILAVAPNQPDALHLLGVIAHQRGQGDIAVDFIRKAIGAMPSRADYHCNLGNVLKAQGQLDQTIAAYRMAVQLKPNFVEAHYSLGNALLERGELDEAIVAYRAAIQFKPDYAEAYYNLGVVLAEQGKLDQAIAAYRATIQLRPNFAEAQNNLGNIFLDQGQLDAAVAAFSAAVRFKPTYAEAYNNLGNAFKALDQLDQAIAAYCKAIELKPDLADAHYNLGNVFLDESQPDPAVAAYRTAIQLKPTYAEAHNNLGNALKHQGRLDEALEHFRTAMALKPQAANSHSNLVYIMHFHPGYDAAMILAESRRWAERFESPLHGEIRPPENDRNPNRRLKVGYVSPDFSEHPVGRFLLPLLANHNPENVEIFCYSGVRHPDRITHRLRQASHVWREMMNWTDAELAEQVRHDGIDILVDLSLHMSDNRLLVFARKPAPVQVTYLGCCSTTGLQSIDFRLSDRYLDPPGTCDQFYSEKTFRLSHCFWCYPQPDDSPPPGPLPALDRGRLTFGCFNNFSKISAPTVQCWIALMQALPNSRLLLHSHPGEHRHRFCQTFADAGIDSSRVSFSSGIPMRQYLEQYWQVDIALDPFPYGGGTTTCDAFWMGVPVITLAGDRAGSRAGVSLLSNVGLNDWIAHSAEQYVAIAQRWASDLPALARLRQDLRRRTLASPLMDGKSFAAEVEAAYRQMWTDFCASGQPT